jgi:hypothetical protein
VAQEIPVVPRSPAPTTEDTPPAPFTPVGPMQPVELSVMTYNVEGLPWPVRSGAAPSSRPSAAVGRPAREGLEPDVVLLQEGFRDEVAT